VKAYKKYILIGIALMGLALILAACGGAAKETTAPPVLPTPEPCPTAAPCPACPTCPEPPAPVVEVVPYQDEWANSGHNDVEAEAFVHWNEDDPPEIPVNCAKCHSTPGYQDFIGADGSAAGTVDAAVPAPAGGIECQACHNDAAAAMTSVVFPSGVEVTGLGPEARCMQCHQGRASKVQVDDAVTKAGVPDDDTVSDQLGFINIHYFAAASTLYGTITKGGYEYEGKAYDFKNDHVSGYDTCIGCHNQHSLELKIDECAVCHTGVASAEDLKNIRMKGSEVDYDGDGNVEEGISFELDGMREKLYAAIQAYAAEVAKAPIAYNAAAYPYFFNDTNGDGQAGEDESVRDNGYKSWTGRLLKAAYNYQTSLKDPGAFAHGGKYILQLMYDSTEDLNTKLSSPVDLSTANRLDAGHFAGSEEAFRHWDEEGEVPGDCAKCHSRTGLPVFLKEAAASRSGVDGRNVAVPVSNGLNCATCHDDVSTFTRYVVNNVKFPSGAVVTFGEGKDANLCISCHQGRESTTSVNAAIKASGAGDDEVSEKLTFRNPHYFAAGATLFGTEARGAYEYTGQTYNGRNMHTPAFSECINCHSTHGLKVKVEDCATCHPSATSEEALSTIRMSTVDYDGDGDVTEGMAGEVATIQEALYAAIQKYAAETAKLPIIYNGSAYPYFFGDANGNGTVDEGEKAYNAWTPRLLRAAYNYQWVSKDPGAFAHNGKYVIQFLYDSLKDLGGDVSKMTRPEAPPPAQ